MQYSFLPSPLAFIADRETPMIAGRALFNAVYAKWIDLPVETRPELVVFGESLGSYGGQAAFAGAQDMMTRVDGALGSEPPTSLLSGRKSRTVVTRAHRRFCR